jgi:hypothetical protein
LQEKGGDNFKSFMSKSGNQDLLGAAPQVIDTGLNLLGANEATMTGTGGKFYQQATDVL